MFWNSSPKKEEDTASQLSAKRKSAERKSAERKSAERRYNEHITYKKQLKDLKQEMKREYLQKKRELIKTRKRKMVMEYKEKFNKFSNHCEKGKVLFPNRDSNPKYLSYFRTPRCVRPEEIYEMKKEYNNHVIF